jgi:hypothetical protein
MVFIHVFQCHQALTRSHWLKSFLLQVSLKELDFALVFAPQSAVNGWTSSSGGQLGVAPGFQFGQAGLGHGHQAHTAGIGLDWFPAFVFQRPGQ